MRPREAWWNSPHPMGKPLSAVRRRRNGEGGFSIFDTRYWIRGFRRRTPIAGMSGTIINEPGINEPGACPPGPDVGPARVAPGGKTRAPGVAARATPARAAKPRQSTAAKATGAVAGAPSAGRKAVGAPMTGAAPTGAPPSGAPPTGAKPMAAPAGKAARSAAGAVKFPAETPHTPLPAGMAGPAAGKPAKQELSTKVAPKSASAKKPADPATEDVAPAAPAAEAAASVAAAPVAPVAATPLAATPVTAAPVAAAPLAAANDEPAAPVAAAPAPAAAAPQGHNPNAPRMPGGMPGRMMPPPRPMAKAETFVEGDHVVYPTHGVGKVERIAVEEIAGHKLELIHITFEENRMTLRVPVAKARTAGLRKLATRKMFDEAMTVLKGRPRIKRTMWSRRAQEYEAKINSGDPLSIAEVVRDLHRNAGQPDQSFSERQIYEAAMDRLAAELGALDGIDKATALQKLTDFLKTVA